MCVYIKHRAQKPSFPEAKALHRAVWHSRARGASHHYVHTGPDSHTRTHSPDGLTAGGPVPSLLTAPGQEGSRLSGPFQTPSHETETPFPTGKKKKASLNSPADPPPACLELNKLFLGRPLWGRFSSRRRGAVQSLGGTVSGGAGSVCLTGVAGAVGRGVWLLPGLPRTPSVGARHPAQTDAG